MIKLSSIKANPNNPRIIKNEKFEKLKRSIEEFPEMMELRPIVIDENNVIIGGNMRFRALQDLGKKEVPSSWIKKASELTDDQKKRFVITDNASFGEWEWDELIQAWDFAELAAWGVDTPGFDVSPDDMGEGFSLPNGDKAPFQQMTFTLADKQAQQIKNAIADIKATEEYKYAETMGNENSNGNALYLIVMQWAEQKKL